MARKLIMVLLALAVVSPLAGCGRKGKLIPPEGATYPRKYPDITFPDNESRDAENQ